MKQPLIILTGPTAVGKTALSIELARALKGEIISADSMQVYRHMDIGSAKIMPEEMDGIPHHLIDVLEPWEEFNVTRFQAMAKEAMAGIYSRGHVPIVTGGTGFYIQALAYDIDFTENEDHSGIREELEQLAAERGEEHLHQMLAQIDPESARAIHANNVKRVIRAIEYYRLTGEKISEHNKREREKTSPYDLYYYVLTRDRAALYERIDRRVDIMMEQGLVDEVKRLKEMGCTRDMVAMQGLDYLDGTISLGEAVYIIKRDTRHFAKRQLTWFKRERDVRFIAMDDRNAPWVKLPDGTGQPEDDQQKILTYICNDYFGGRNKHGIK